MKHITYLIAALSLIVSSRAFAQTLDTNRAMAITCGGGIDSSTDYAGSVTIGMPFVGEISNTSGDTTRLGLYDDAFPSPMGVVNASAPIIEQAIYPNPSTGEFSIVPPDGTGEISRIELLDEAGHVVADLTHSATTDADGIHVKSSGLASGTYFVRADARGGEYLYKIVINRDGK